MIYISHRGNINGRNPQRENEPSYIIEALNQGYDVEVDVWWNNIDGLSIGHDNPLYPINESFLQNNHIWSHAKNIKALKFLLEIGCHCFSHDKDECVLTSRNKIWVYPDCELIEGSIAVLPEKANYTIEYLKEKCYAICSDKIEFYKNQIEI